MPTWRQRFRRRLTRFETEKFTEKDLDRIKAGLETRFYNSISSVLTKGFQLARYEEYAGGAGYLPKHLEKLKAVQSKDVWRVYEKYVKGKPFVLTCFVPKGKPELAANGCEKFVIPAESIDEQKKQQAQAAGASVKIEAIPSKFDRSVEPAAGASPLLKIPPVWQVSTASGMRVLGISQRELPLVSFTLVIKGGHLLDPTAKAGTANLAANLMMQGTARKTPVELEEAIDELGASISLDAEDDSITLGANCLANKLEAVMALVEEILFEPRWDAKEFDRVKRQTLERIRRNQASPAAIATNVFRKIVYGPDHALGATSLGSLESVGSITLDDLRAYYSQAFAPKLAHVAIAGDVDQQRATAAFERLSAKWPARSLQLPTPAKPPAPAQSKVYFVDVPNARQSEIRIGYVALASVDPDYYPATVANYKLGGSFNAVVNLILREEKGYTYGARTGFSGGLLPGAFTASAAVQANATLESAADFP